jgi:hypothetical protein
MNRNKIIISDFSNPETAIIDQKQGYKDFQCGGCSFYAPFNFDLGLCCNPKSHYKYETVTEHFSCKNVVPESWTMHSFYEGRHHDFDTVYKFLKEAAEIIKRNKFSLSVNEKELLLKINHYFESHKDIDIY